jgi:hypothetical protein
MVFKNTKAHVPNALFQNLSALRLGCLFSRQGVYFLKEADAIKMGNAKSSRGGMQPYLAPAVGSNGLADTSVRHEVEGAKLASSAEDDRKQIWMYVWFFPSP